MCGAVLPGTGRIRLFSSLSHPAVAPVQRRVVLDRQRDDVSFFTQMTNATSENFFAMAL